MFSIPKQVLSDILGKLSIRPVHLEVKSARCHAFCRCQHWGVLATEAVGEPQASWRCLRTGKVWPSPAVVQVARTGSAPTPWCAARARGDGGPSKSTGQGAMLAALLLHH